MLLDRFTSGVVNGDSVRFVYAWDLIVLAVSSSSLEGNDLKIQVGDSVGLCEHSLSCCGF